MVSSSQSLSQCSYTLNNEISTKTPGDRRGIRECKKVIKELDIRIGPVEWAEGDLDRWGIGIETRQGQSSWGTQLQEEKGEN